ncbi:hypothetical protein ACVMB3_005078 [Sinorhizobium meliloti]
MPHPAETAAFSHLRAKRQQHREMADFRDATRPTEGGVEASPLYFEALLAQCWRDDNRCGRHLFYGIKQRGYTGKLVSITIFGTRLNAFPHAIHIAAILGLYLSAAMLIPAMLDLYYGHSDWQVFAAAAFVTSGLSATTFMATRAGPPPFSKKFGFVLVNVLRAAFALIGALPLWMSSLDLDFAQALFEWVSAITTTGSTVIVGLDDAPPGSLIWRSLICWLGGVGIVVLGLFIIPYLRVGGMSFFKMESSDTNEKPFTRLATFSRAFFHGLCRHHASLCHRVQPDRHEPVRCDQSRHVDGRHRRFSTHDASFAYFGSIPLLWTATFFMTLCSLPFSILIAFVARGRLSVLLWSRPLLTRDTIIVRDDHRAFKPGGPGSARYTIF